MRILHVSHAIPPDARTGVENYTVALARAQAAAGHTVAAYARGRSTGVRGGTEERAEDEEDGFLSVRVHLGPGHHFGHQRMRRLQSERFRQFVAEFAPDVVHFHHLLFHSLDYPAIARAAGAGTVLTLHDFWFTCPTIQRFDYKGDICPLAPGRVCLPCLWNGKRDRIVPRESIARLSRTPHVSKLLDLVPTTDDLEDWAAQSQHSLSDVDIVISPSQVVADSLTGNGITPARLVITDYGIAAPDIASDLVPEGQAAGDEPPLRLGVIGTHRLKGVHVAVEAFERLGPDVPAELIVFGARPEQLGLELPGNARAWGPFSAADLETVYGAMDALIVPSIWLENAPFVIREAFARGKPVLTSDVGGMAESVAHDVDGLRFPVGDAPALAACVRRLIEEPGLLARLRAGIRAPKYMDEHLNELEVLYSQARTARSNSGGGGRS